MIGFQSQYSTVGTPPIQKATAFGERASRQLLLEPMIRERIAFCSPWDGIGLLMTAQKSPDRKLCRSSLFDRDERL
jgi:hypothetical protein